MAPEVLKKGNYGQKSDIYSFGMLVIILQGFENDYSNHDSEIFKQIDEMDKFPSFAYVASNNPQVIY